MWIARDKDGEFRIFEMPPRRFHSGYDLSSEYVGFNDDITVEDGKDVYSFWAVQEFYESNYIENRKCYGIQLRTETIENGVKGWRLYIPEDFENMTWEDEPIEVDIIPHVKK